MLNVAWIEKRKINHYSKIKKQQKQQNEKYEIKLFYGGPSLPIKKYFFSFVSK